MINDKAIEKVTNFLSNEYSKNISDIAIFKNQDGTYELFGKYSITQVNEEFIVTTSIEKLSFSSLRNAVTWCVCENHQKYSRSNRIKYLDQMISSANVVIDMHKKLLKKNKDMEFTLIHLAKLNEERIKRSNMINEMNSYIQESIHWQTKKFSVKR